MTLAEWSWVTAAISITVAMISSRSPRWGWMCGIAAQAVWMAAGIFTGQPGTVLLSVVFVGIDLWSLWRWRGTPFTPAQHRITGPPHRTPMTDQT